MDNPNFPRFDAPLPYSLEIQVYPAQVDQNYNNNPPTNGNSDAPLSFEQINDQLRYDESDDPFWQNAN